MLSAKKGILKSCFSLIVVLLLFLFMEAPASCSEIIRIEFSNLAKVLPWQETPGALSSGGVKLHSCRENITSSERWLDMLVKLDTDKNASEATKLRVSAFTDKDFSKPLASSEIGVEGPSALVSMDMRKLPAGKIRLRTEWLDSKNNMIGAGETWISADLTGTLAPDTRIPLTIDIPEGIESVDNYPVRFGVPFPAGTVWEAKDIKVVDASGKEIPSQLEIAGRWAHEGSVKWMLFDSLVSGKNGSIIYVVPGRRTSASSPSKSVTITRQGDIFNVNTGTAQFVVGTGGSLIKEAGLNRQVAAREGNSRGLYVIDQNGRLAKAFGKDASGKIESAGPVSAVIKIEGFYKTDEGESLARHITRLQFSAGRSEVSATHTLILTRDTNELWFREAGWEFETGPGNEAKALFNLSAEKNEDVQTIPLTGGRRVNIIQTDGINLGLKPVSLTYWNRPNPSTPWVPYLHGKNVFEVHQTGSDKVVYDNRTMGDWTAVSGRASGWMVSCRNAAAQHPKEFELEENRINLKLFSPASGRELDFRMESLMKNWGMLPKERVAGFSELPEKVLENYLNFISKHKSNAAGWSKTHDIILSPLASDSKPYGISLLHSKQLFVHVSPAWIRETLAIGPIHPRDRERFPEAETVIDGLFWGLVKMWNGGPFGGFVDYHAGPNRIVHNYRTGGYSLRADSWYLYMRSAERGIREFAQGSNRAFMDNNIAHWEVPDKVPGLFIRSNSSPGTLQGRNRVSDLPMHWQGIGDQYELSTVVNMDQMLNDYYLTGYRRSADILSNFSDAAKNTLTYEKVHWRVLLTMRHIAQAYVFTWEPKLREILYELNNRYMYDPEGEVLLTKRRPYRSTTYKTETDQDTLLLMWQIFRDPMFKKMGMAIGKSNWDKASILPPIKGQNRATGFTYYFLWEETNDPSMISGFDYARRRLVADRLADLATGEVKITCTSQIPRFFKGLPLSMDILLRTGADKKTPASWLAFKIENSPIRVFFTKPGENIMGHNLPVKEIETAMNILVRKEGSASVEHIAPRVENSVPKPAEAGGRVILKPHVILGAHPWAGHDLNTVTERSNKVTRVNIPKDAPGGTYELVINDPGDYSIFSDRFTPLVLHAPDGWTPPKMNPPVRIYFRAGEKKSAGRIFFEKGVRLFMPDGTSFKNGESVAGWVDIPEEAEGMWSFESIEPGMVKTEKLPGFFAMGDPAFYMEHE